MADLISTLSANLNLSDEQLAVLRANADSWKQSELQQLVADVAKAEMGTKLTSKGFDLLAKAAAGEELRFTRIKLGDANGQSTTDEQEYYFNDLINPRFEAKISECKFTGGGTVAVAAVVENAKVEEGFRIAEVGLFALDPESGEEQLYCYRNSNIAASWMPSGDGAVLWNIKLTIITVIDKAQNVTAVIDGGLVYVTQTELLDHISSSNPHPNIPVKGEELETANTVWVNGNDDKLHPMAIDTFAKQMLGGEASTLPQMNSRLAQAEINLTNLYTQLNAKDELGLTGNLILIEPFTEKDCCDLYENEVITAVAGSNNIQINSDRGVQVGSTYTLTDGTRSEQVQVKSIARSDEAVVVFFTSTLSYTYDLTRTNLMRTTVSFNGNTAEGAGDIRGSALTFNKTFTGTGGNVTRTLILDTSQSNAVSFTVTGDGTFTADGYFTLL